MTGLVLPPLDLADRASGVRARLDEGQADADALLVTDLTNIRWLTGFTGSNAVVVVLPDDVVVVTDGRYGDQAERQLAQANVTGRVLVGHSASAVSEHLAAIVAPLTRLAFESAHVSHQQFVRYAATLRPTLVPTVGLIEAGRRTKTPAEIARIETACHIADQALAEVIPSIVPGHTEAQVRNMLEVTMRELGASGPSYDTIVATGPRNAPLPHHRPTDTVIEDGHTVIVDVGALLDGYHSDMTRTFLVGQPSALQREVYDVVLAAQRAGVDAVRPGADSKALDAVCRDAIDAAGFGQWFSHGTGHGVGLLIHEDPFVNASGGFELQVGDVVTIEPGVYRGDLGGVRVEDLVEVTSAGGRVLTRSPKDSPCLPSAPTT